MSWAPPRAGGGVNIRTVIWGGQAGWVRPRVGGGDGLGNPAAVHTLRDSIQNATTLLPDYALRAAESALSSSAAGLIGCGLVFGLALAAGTMLRASAAREAA